jgi:hypothetical protein
VYVLIDDDRAGLALRRLRPWHRLLARCQAGRLDRELADGRSPVASATLAARAMRLTSMGFRRDLAASLQRIVVATGEPPQPVSASARPIAAAKSPGTARPPRLPLRRARISQSARLLAELAGRLAEPGPVPVRGVAMVTRLLSDGTGPLYREAARDDLRALAERAAQTLTWS